MDLQLSDRQREARQAARRFAAERVAPWAGHIDRHQTTPNEVLLAMRQSGYLGAALPVQWGGGAVDPISYGLITEEIGRACSSTRSLMTVHNMTAQAIAKLGTREQREQWLPDLCSGRKIAAFALSEPNVGSTTAAIETEAVERESTYVLQGTKKWITYGQVADVFLVFALCNGQAIALLVERGSDGLAVEALKDIEGTRGSMLAMVHFRQVVVPKANQVGATGAGLSLVSNIALDHGRFSVAWGSTGIIHACLDACVAYVDKREQGGQKLKEHQLVRRHVTDMLVSATASRALCYRSGHLRERGDPRAVMETCLAKYHASSAAVRAATTAVHLHGANGCSGEYPVSRYLRDSMVMSIIEGSDEIHQVTLANYALQRPYLD
jgi:alkylation response protein AidB-like acyl-CoA dehydrogenase